MGLGAKSSWQKKVTKDVNIAIETIQAEEQREKRLREVESGFSCCGSVASRLMHVQLGSKDKKRTGAKNMCDTTVNSRNLKGFKFPAVSCQCQLC